MARLLTLTVLTLFVAGAALAQNTAYFYPTDDAYVDSATPDGNFGSSLNLYLGDRAPAGGGTALSFLQFDVSDLTGYNEVLNAELWLYQHEKYGAPTQQVTVTCHHITTPGWDENAITWNAPPGYNTTPSASATGFFNPPGWTTFNVTADVIADKNSGITGFAIKCTPLVQWVWLNFWSSEQVPMPDYRPMLEITYSGPVPAEESSWGDVKALFR